MEARIEAIYICPGGGEPLASVSRADAVEARGLRGDRYFAGSGHWSGRGSDPVTLIEAEVVEALAPGGYVPPGSLRRNLLVRGVRLEHLVGRRFHVGGTVVLEGVRPCDPCGYLETLCGRPGLKEDLRSRGGLRANVVRGGVLRVGDPLRLLAF